MDTIIGTMWKPTFKEKRHYTWQKQFSWPVKTVFFPFGRCSWLWKQLLLHVETYFLTDSLFRLVETDFLSSGNSIPLFRALLKFLKFGGNNIFQRHLYLCSWKLIFWLMEINYFYFSDTPVSESYFSSSGKVCLNEFFIPHNGDEFFVLWKPFSLI